MWLQFLKSLGPYRVFSTRDVRKLFPDMNLMNLVRWQKKGYLIKIRNGWYCFDDTESSENIDWLAANLIYDPSYISLHSALSYYGLIPEAVYVTTSITTRKTNGFDTTLGKYSYHHVKPDIFSFGQILIDVDNERYRQDKSRKILLAAPEKALLDFFYIHSMYNTEKEIEHLRLDGAMLDEIIKEKFFSYLEKYKNRALEDRVFKMMKVYA